MKMEWIYKWQLGERVRGLSHQGHTLLANHRAADVCVCACVCVCVCVWGRRLWILYECMQASVSIDTDLVHEVINDK